MVTTGKRLYYYNLVRSNNACIFSKSLRRIIINFYLSVSEDGSVVSIEASVGKRKCLISQD